MRSDFFDTSDGVRLHVLESQAKPARGQELVLAFIPGWSMPASIWQAQFRGLSDRYRVAALDPRGQGCSGVPADGYTVERRACDIDEFLRRYARVVLIGWSLGALEVLHCVHRHGDSRVAGVILVDSSVGEQPQPARSRFVESLVRDRREALANFVHAIFHSARPTEQYRSLLDAALRMPLQASIDLLSYPQPREHWRDIARALEKPLCYVVTPQFAAQASNLQKHRPATRVEVFERAGHALFVDEPQRFNRLVDDFVGSL